MSVGCGKGSTGLCVCVGGGGRGGGGVTCVYVCEFCLQYFGRFVGTKT